MARRSDDRWWAERSSVRQDVAPITVLGWSAGEIAAYMAAAEARLAEATD